MWTVDHVCSSISTFKLLCDLGSKYFCFLLGGRLFVFLLWFFFAVTWVSVSTRHHTKCVADAELVVHFVAASGVSVVSRELSLLIWVEADVRTAQMDQTQRWKNPRWRTSAQSFVDNIHLSSFVLESTRAVLGIFILHTSYLIQIDFI